MTQRKNRIFSALVVLTMGASMAIGTMTGNLTLAFVLALAGLSALIFNRRSASIEEPIRDERDLLIDAKSSTAALQVFLAETALLGSALIFLGVIGYAAFEQTGYVLLVLAAVGSLIHLAFRDHFGRVYGG